MQLHGPIPLIGTSTYPDLFSDASICLCTVRPKPHIRIHLSDEKFKFLRILSFSARGVMEQYGDICSLLGLQDSSIDR